MKIRIASLVLLMLCATLFCGCQKKSGLQAAYVLQSNSMQSAVSKETVSFTVDNTTPYENLITKSVDIHTFAQAYSGAISPYVFYMSQIAEDIGMECVRETEDGALYSVHKAEQGGLLYIFYHNEAWRAETENRPVLRWFYVRSALTYADFGDLSEEGRLMADMIRVDETEQIFENIWFGQWTGETPPEEFCTWHYLNDGILELWYRKNDDGQAVLFNYTWKPDFDLDDWQASKDTPYNARILDIDLIK